MGGEEIIKRNRFSIPYFYSTRNPKSERGKKNFKKKSDAEKEIG
jgi:hypothetical protein